MAGAKKPVSGSKAQLKAIAEAVKGQKYDDATQLARGVLETDPENYQALIFLGFVLDKTDKLDEAVSTYEQAAVVKPSDPQVWQGLIKVFEKQGSKSIAKYKMAALRLAEIYRDEDDMYKCQVVVDKFVDFARVQATGLVLADALGIILPDSPIYPALEGRVMRPAATYERIAQIIEAEETRRINTLIGERRTRLGARLVEVTAEVKREVYAESWLVNVYGEIINWTNDDDLRRTYEEKLLAYRAERLAAFLGEQKQQELVAVRDLAKGMVIIKHPYQLAWDITIDYEDFEEIAEWDARLLWEYRSLFSTTGLGKVLAGFLTSDLSPFSKIDPTQDPEDAKKKDVESKEEKETKQDEGEKENSEGVEDESGDKPAEETTLKKKKPEPLPTTDEERLALMKEGVAEAKSLLAYRMMAAWYKHAEEHLRNVNLMRKALAYLDERRTDSGIAFKTTEDVFRTALGTALVYYQEPHNHPEAKKLFGQVLEHNAKATQALIGVGLISKEEVDYDAAITFLERALEQDGADLRVRSETAWVYSLKGDYAHARDELEECIPLLSEQGLPAKKLLALTQYRYGVCLWNLDSSRAARKDRNGAYKHFLGALKNDLNLAPAYTSLGIFYEDYSKDRKRAFKCFIKALELSDAELEAGRRLVQSYADKRDWDSIELVAQRVIDSGKATPPFGSKKKAHSWPFSALGTSQLHKKEYNKAMMSFRMATRLEPNDYHSCIALAETYLWARMHYSAVRAIEQAQRIQAAGGGGGDGYQTWFTDYLLGNIYRGMGEFDNAIELYRGILKERPNEEGVLIALMHAMAESADTCVKTGLFGDAVDKAVETLEFAAHVPKTTTNKPGFWTAVASACAVFSTVQGKVTEFPAALSRSLILVNDGTDESAEGDAEEHTSYKLLQEFDGVGTKIVLAGETFSGQERVGVDLTRCMQATILAYKRALHVTAPGDMHMYATAYYNLGWAEYRAHTCLPSDLRNSLNGYLRAAIQCFKRAIEIEAGNRVFWNALGVATSAVHPPVSQHALARSLYLGRDKAQKVTAPVWANMGTLALLHHDIELANKAFAEGQSSDPDDATSWLGQGFVALQYGEAAEARSLFMHAMDLSDASSVAARQQYAVSLFDHLEETAEKTEQTATPVSDDQLVRPLIGLEQVRRLRPNELPYSHLFALFRERIHDADSTVPILEEICSTLEADFEVTESAAALRRFAVAKADLTRAYVALGAYDKAVESGEMTLQLVEGGDDTDNGGSSQQGLTKREKRKIQLSSRVSTGLARYFLHDFDGAVADFEALLGESDDDNNDDAENGSSRDPDVVCLFVQVLWATGTEDNRQRAQDELFGVIEAHPDHIQAILLLGAVALLNGDEESAEAVVAELEGLQGPAAGDASTGRAVVSASQQVQVGQMLHALAKASSDPATASRRQAQKDIMLHPHLPQGWANLAEGDDEEEDGEVEDGYDYASDMALNLTQDLLPPRGTLGPEELARACVGTRRAGDAQVAIFAAPWLADGWEGLAAAIA